MMDGIQSWSTFEERQRNSGESRNEISTTVSSSDVDVGIDALYVSSSSPNIAPAAATLLRNSGLSGAPSSSVEEMENDGNSCVDSKSEEFRLKFHWMRPHPSLVFAVEDEFQLLAAGTEATEQSNSRKKQKHMNTNPAMESSRLMEAYRSSQMTKSIILAGDSACNNTADAPEDDSNESSTATNINNVQPPVGDLPKNSHHLPMEFPKLRINLASLVEPPLMTSWLPEDDTEN
ncbi:hypothetical protein ACHAWU_006900 [Discostella pseudostelligera]|uniref:Uncharacterized protein n=1 Tax=Discostella pseudostelligera TaxID=259834 RepID=A0ABD3MY05_9STRA